LNRWRKELLKTNDAWNTRVETHSITITDDMLDYIIEQRENRAFESDDDDDHDHDLIE
jgi:hypothetical protein